VGEITWSSDGSVSRSGWKLCAGDVASTTTTTATTTTTPTTTTSPAPEFGNRSWLVSQGPCTVDSSGCLLSPHYPHKYGGHQSCTILVNEASAEPISVHGFDTEKGYDILELNGKKYSGNDGPEGITPSGKIMWESDGSIHRQGWKLCMGAISTTVTTTTTGNNNNPWLVSQGPCTVDSSGCALSPHYPAKYGDDESCTIVVKRQTTGSIIVHSFHTERRYDFLEINGKRYSGLRSPQGVSPVGEIRWKSDGSVRRRVWKLCINDTTTHLP